MTKIIAGYQNNFFRKIIIIFVNFIINLLFLKKNSEYSNEFNQALSKNLKKKIIFDGKTIIFKTGHNRLNNRGLNFSRMNPF